MMYSIDMQSFDATSQDTTKVWSHLPEDERGLAGALGWILMVQVGFAALFGVICYGR